MNVLVFDSSVAETLINNQSGQHRLGPVALTDGRYFLMDDVLSEEKFANQLVGVEYITLPFSEIQSLLPVSDEEII